MPKLPVLSGRELISVLEKIGYAAVRQRGSHVRLHHSTRRPLTVPLHPFIGKRLLRKILRDGDITPKELMHYIV